MIHKLELPKPATVNHAEVLRWWGWFRARLVELHGVGGLPVEFGESDGEIVVIEGNPDDELRAPEYNYTSRDQTLRVAGVAIHTSYTDIGDSFWFDYVTEGHKIELFMASWDCYLAIDDEVPQFSWWREAVRALAPC